MRTSALSITFVALVACGGSVSTNGDPASPVDDASASDIALDDASLDDVSTVDATLDDATLEAPLPLDSATDTRASDSRARPDVVDDLGGGDAASWKSCPSDMITLPGFCMDRYEAPNVAGEKPLAMETAIDGQAWCVAHGKRLCSEAEWVRACNGTTKRPYPYGASYVRGECTDDKTWIAPNWTTLGGWPSAAAKAEAARLYQADPSGSRAGCTSEEGAFDLTGNVAEWVTRSFPNATNYDHVMKGCYWSGCYGGSPPSCGFVNPAHPGTFRSYEAGFRCCASR